jgi:hypothetical protein
MYGCLFSEAFKTRNAPINEKNKISSELNDKIETPKDP